MIACTKNLWAFAAITVSPGANAHYRRRRDRGDWHAAAQRNLFNRMLGVLYHCLQNRVPYNEQRAFAPLLEPAAVRCLSAVLTSMPGIGVRTAARILIRVGDGSAFATAGHLAANAGLAPVTRASGSSIRGEHPARRGNKQFKRAFYLAAFASLSQPESRAYYDRKVRHEAPHHRVEVRGLRRWAVAAVR